MYRHSYNFRGTVLCRLTVFLLVFCLGIDPVILAAPASARAGISFPEPTAMIQPSAAFVPAVMRGLQFDTENPFEFNFIIDTGENDIEGPALEEESGRLIRYFLAALTVPEKDLWVNLAPREAQRIITPELGVTLMGRDMLAQDYLLKQFASSLMYPDGEVGRKFWERVYKRAQQQFGTTDIPLGSFNKVWIVPAEAKVFENESGAYVIGTRLKVMLEDEYARASDLVGEPPAGSEGNNIANALVKEILIPEIEREVNEGEHFARLRQIYHSLILATWYKRTLKDSILTQQYADHNKVAGVDEIQPGATDQIYDQYMQAVRKGVYNFIKEDYDPATHETVPRKYMSGGLQIVPEVDQATLAEMMTYLRSTEARQWRWKKVRTELRRPKEWGSRFLKEGPYPEPPLVLTGKDQEIYRQANGRPRPMDADEVGRLLERITRSEKIRFIRRDLGPYTVSTGIAVTEEGMQYRMLNVGHLFLMDNRFYYFMDPELRRELGQNVILLDRFDSLEVVRRGQDMYAAAAIVSMLQRQDWENYTVVDVGAGVGVLSLVAHKLGARYVELIENLPRKVEQAKIQMQLNGLKLGPDYDVHQIDLSDAKQVRRTVNVIGQRRDEKDSGRRFAIISNIGYWPKVRERGVQVYSASNQNSMDLMEGLSGVNLFIGSGYNVTTDLKNLEATAPDMNRLEDLGFEIPEAALVKLPDREPIISLTAVRTDQAMLTWLRPPGGHGTEGYDISQEPTLTLAPQEIDKLAGARGRARRMGPDEQRRLLELLMERDILYRSSPAPDFYQDQRIDRRDYSRRGERAPVFSQIGPLFLMDREYFLDLADDVRKELGSNVIVLDDLKGLQMYDRRFALYADAAIAMILDWQDWEGRQVIDVGAGEGVLGLVAFKLGADFIEAFDNDTAKLEIAKNQYRLNGLAAGTHFRVHAGDLRNTGFVNDRIAQIENRLATLAGAPEVTVVSNIGLWPVARFSDREPQYHITNQTAFDMAAQIPGVSAIIASGYNVTKIGDYEKAIKRDLHRLEELGFRRERRPVTYHQTDLQIAFTAVRPDAAIFGKPGKLQDWLRRFRGEQKRRGEQPAWGRAKDLTPRQSEALMDRFRVDPKLITLRWDGELSPGQPYGQFELDGRLWVRENAYIRRVNGPGDLVIVRLGPLMLMDRTFYLELDDTVKEELGPNVVLISRLNDSSLNSTLFHIYNSSTALAMIAQGSYDNHHVIDVGSGDGILALIAHKLGAKYSELIEADAYSLMRASHQLILNGMDPDTDFSVHLGDITDEEFVRKETAFMIANMEKRGADSLSVVANIGQWDDYYGKVNNRTVIALLNGLPPVDRLVLGGYDVTSVSRNKEVVEPDREVLAARRLKVSEMQLRYAGKPMTVAMVATAPDSALMAQIEAHLQNALKLDEERLERGVVSVNGRDIAVTQYRNRQFEEVPYLRVGEFLVINNGIADYLPAAQRAQLEANPGVIFLDREEFTDAFAYERWEGYGGFTLAVMAAMQAFREKINGHTFVDFGAGSGVLSIIASRLGARDVIAIEGREEAQPILARNLAANNVPNVKQFHQMIESIDALELSPQPVFALNLPYFGLLLGSGERAVTLLKALDLVAEPAVAIISGGSFGRGSIDDAVIRILEQRGADVIESTLIKRHVREPDLAVSNVFSGVFETKIIKTADADGAMFSKSSRRKLFERLLGLVDRYTDRIPPQFAVSREPLVSLTQNNPYFQDFLGSLNIDVTIPPRLQQQGFWRYELNLDQPQRRRLMDLLSKHSHVPDRDMPKKWSVIFYKGEPLLLVMEGLHWNSFSEGMQNSLLDQHASYLFGKGITETGMRKYIEGLASLKWSRAISLIPVNSERVSLTDRMHLALLAKWTDASSDGPVIVADTLFDLTPIPGVSTRVVTSWGSYDARSMESTMFRVGIHPRPGELIYLLGTGTGADALYTAERTGGDVRIVATDIDPYLLGNARSNISASPYAGSIRLVQADLFDFEKEDGEKADRILFNIPLDSQITGRNRDSRTSDPGMQLLNRLLTEAKDHLKEGGTLEVNYMTRPSFFAAVYNAGWEVAEVTGQDIFNQLENADMQAFQYLRFVLKRQDPAHAEQNAKALSDLQALAKMERPLMMALTTQDGQGRSSSGLSQRKREEFRQSARNILRKWDDEVGMATSVVRTAADGVGWMARSNLRLGSRYKHPDRLAEPYFTLEPNPMSVMGRIEDMSMLAADTKLIETDWSGYWADHLRQYFGRDRVTEEELDRYRAVEAVISDDVKYALLRDRALQPVFMQIMPDGFVGELETNDVVDTKLDTLIDGRSLREFVEEYSAFRVGRLETAAKVIAAGDKIVVGVTDRSHDLTMGIRARIANGRQTYFPLPDGSWLGVKGSGYNYAYLGAAEKSPFMFTDRVSYGLFPRYQAIRQLDIFNVLGVNQQGFADFLGVRRLQMLPDGEGRFESVNLYLDNHPEREDAWPYLSFHRVSSPHRLVSFGQLLSTPGSL
ncbi:MAG: 50S ribosomal protein L11 methyltransferase, partial [Candidatus Omnitrophica bacterium]|nr:50S ribosomal protein L11 methyltransferase [Candidatus Omnitrophota bacterium]